MPERLVFTVRPDGTPLWLSEHLAAEIGAKRRQRLTAEQMQHPNVRAYIQAHTAKNATP